METLKGEFSGKLKDITLGASPTLVLEDRTLALRDVLSISLNTAISHHRELRFELTDGGVLFAGVGGPSGDNHLPVNGTLFPENVPLTLDGLQKIYSLDLTGPEEVAGPELPLQTENDLLVTREGARFKGIVESFGREGVVFEEEQLGSMGRLPWSQIHGLSIAPLGPPSPPKKDGVAVWLRRRDGSRLAVQLTSLDLAANKAAVSSPIFGDVQVELDRVQSFEFRLGRVAYVSEREPLRVEEGSPHIAKELAPHFKWQRDRAVLEKTPLRIGKATYARGLGVHSNSKLVFPILPQDRTFQTWIGIDVIGKPKDEDMPAGHVVFKVLVDGVPRLEKAMSWRDAAHRVQIDINGAKELSLIVEMGESLHILDRADWGDARILRD